jgi:malate synthase
MLSYSLLVIQACHHRGAHAIGGMAAQRASHTRQWM